MRPFRSGSIVCRVSRILFPHNETVWWTSSWGKITSQKVVLQHEEQVEAGGPPAPRGLLGGGALPPALPLHRLLRTRRSSSVLAKPMWSMSSGRRILPRMIYGVREQQVTFTTAGRTELVMSTRTMVVRGMGGRRGGLNKCCHRSSSYGAGRGGERTSVTTSSVFP